MTLSYDFVFLAAVRCHLAGEVPKIKKMRCIPHPIRARKCVVDSKELNYCADASALLAYQKCKDDFMDEHGFKKFRAVLTLPFLAPAYRRAKKRHPALDQKIADHLERLHQYEMGGSEPSADIPASIFGDLMKDVCSQGMEGTSARLAAEIGQTLGRWIYLVDAADDLADDRKKNRFNPYTHLLADPPTKEDAETLRVALKAILCETERAYLLMGEPPCPELGEILSNILYLGLPMAAERVLTHGFLETKQKTKKENTDE